MSLKDDFAKLKSLIAEAEDDVNKIVDKNQKAARPRLRKKMQEIKEAAQTVRVNALEKGETEAAGGGE